MNLEAKILRKSVKSLSAGKTMVSFLVYNRGEERWLSAFTDSKTPQDTIDTLRLLGEGDKAAFEIKEVPKGDKTYYNIVSVVMVKDIRDEAPAEPEAPQFQPDGHGGQRRAFQDAPDSMVIAFAKDGAVRLSKDGDTPEEFVNKVFIIYGGLKAILAGLYEADEPTGE